MAEVPVFNKLPLPNYNVRPSQECLVVVGRERRIERMRWGLIPSWSKEPQTSYSTFNARVENIANKPTYRTPFRRTRCLIPASGYYEWRKINGYKQPYYLYPEDQKLLGLGGVYDTWTDENGTELKSFSIITLPASGTAAEVHSRMPAIIDPQDYTSWLDPSLVEPDEILALLTKAERELAIYPVSTAVNKPGINNADLIKRVSLP